MTEGRAMRRLVGIYHADGGARGELSYVVGRMLGQAHCGLCDITHGRLKRKRAWDALVDQLAVPFDLVHLNERDRGLIAASQGRTPCVLADVGDGRYVLVLGPADLDAVGGDVKAFGRELRASLEREGFALGPA